MTSPYEPPKSNVDSSSTGDFFNTSGMGKGQPLPDGVKAWSWGAFFWNWIWAIGNSTWIGLLALVPYIGFIMAIVLGFNGREWAWQNKRWDSLEHFNSVQRKWSLWALILPGIAAIGILAAVLIPLFASAKHG